MRKSNKLFPTYGWKMKQQFIGLQHCSGILLTAELGNGFSVQGLHNMR